ncbi:hypothetical protein INR49_028461 [Caranx melampygus]|nr:hypothetical protein INR49_028461 [Caranx melampygus]
MQCLRDQDALIPRPRGNLPKVCAAALAAITIAGIMFLSPERLFGWVTMVILIMTLGPLLHGLCLLAEEMLYHSNTRYQGQGLLSHVLPACGLGGLEDSITSFRDTHQVTSHLWGRGSKKLLILIPLNANISHKLEDEDNQIYFYKNLPNNEIDRAGVRSRVYKHSVYRVLDEQGRWAHLCVVEYATPLLTLYKMSQESNEHGDDPHFLSKAILRHLQQQETEEFDLPLLPQQEAEHPLSKLQVLLPVLLHS